MNGSIVRATTPDGVQLQGLLFKGDGKAQNSVVIHLHGIWGNFYANSFIDHFAEFYPHHGYSFMSVNLRGHDEGAMTDRFENCQKDIPTWLDFARRSGYTNIILQGHSLGALQAVFFLQNAPSQNDVVALILLSPFDNVAFYCTDDRTIREKRIGIAEAIANVDPNTVIPKELFDMWLLSAGTYLDLIGFDTKSDIFPFRNGTLEGTPIASINLPVFAAVGANDFAAFPSPKAEIEQLNALRRVHAFLIEGAPHNFAGQETAILNNLSLWLKE